MEIAEREYGSITVRDRNGSDDERHKTTGTFLKGFIVGFGAAAAVGVIFGIFRESAERRKVSRSTASRIRTQDESGGVIGDLSNIIDESTTAFKDAVQTLDRTFESGRMALESFQDVINKIRE